MRTLLGCSLVLAVCCVALADDKKDEKIDAKLLIGKWAPKEEPNEGEVALYEFQTDGEVRLTHRVLGGGYTNFAAYKLDGNILTTTQKFGDKEIVRPVTVLKLTDAELTTKDDKGKVRTFLRVKERKIDPKLLVGRWSPKQREKDEGATFILEWEKGGKAAFTSGRDGKESRLEGTYTLKGNTLATTMKSGDRERTITLTVTKLTDTHLVADDEKGKVVTLTRLDAKKPDPIDPKLLIGRWELEGGPKGVTEVVEFAKGGMAKQVVTRNGRDWTSESEYKIDVNKLTTKSHTLTIEKLTDAELVMTSDTGETHFYVRLKDKK